MKAVFWGVRGSTPAPGASTVQYGGNTSCIELRLARGDVVILDSGTGIRQLGQKLLQESGPVKATIIFSHFHWDHIQGFPFFRPAFVKGTELTLVGKPTATTKIRDILAGQMDSVYFPVDFGYMSATFRYYPVTEMDMEIGSTQVKFIETNHTSKCLAARFDEDGRSLIYMTDNELEKNTPTTFREFVKFCRGADILVHDAQYTPETYRGHEGWGHSTWESVIRLAKEADVKELYLYHHDPDSTDSHVKKILRDSRASSAGGRLKIHAAREGLELKL